MNQAIIVGVAVILLLFVWTWIGMVIMNRISLERKIEKLSAITNPLPDEERNLRQLKDLRSMEQAKVGSAKLVIVTFMLFLIVTVAVAPWYEPLRELFGFETLRSYVMMAIIALTFFCIPTFVGLSLAGARPKDEGKANKVASGKAA